MKLDTAPPSLLRPALASAFAAVLALVAPRAEGRVIQAGANGVDAPVPFGGAPQRPSWTVGSQMPNLELPRIDGRGCVRLAELGDEPTLVVHFASWSSPSRSFVPVWRELTRAAREAGELRMIGIVQEQHPDRATLFAQWQDLDFPILWDPFALCEVDELPFCLAIGEGGRILDRPAPDSWRDAFDPEAIAEAGDPNALGAPTEPAPIRAELARAPIVDEETALAHLLFERHAWGVDDPRDAAIALLEEARAELAGDARAAFRLGVAYALRRDLSANGHAGDFQRSLDAWKEAVDGRPQETIWRRRLQLYGPRLDKPFAFYDWIERAREDLDARHAAPSPLLTPLTTAEIAEATNAMPTNLGEHASPDPARRVEVDRDGLLMIETAVAPHSGRPGARVRAAGAARVHVEWRLAPDAGLRFDDEAGPILLWVATPREWRIERNLFTPEVDSDAARARRLDFEVVAARGVGGPDRLRAYALYHLKDAAGETRRFRQDFEIEVPVPAPPPGYGD